jgi:hypothetical protein
MPAQKKSFGVAVFLGLEASGALLGEFVESGVVADASLGDKEPA